MSKGSGIGPPWCDPLPWLSGLIGGRRVEATEEVDVEPGEMGLRRRPASPPRLRLTPAGEADDEKGGNDDELV
jgi:hypothetical protein